MYELTELLAKIRVELIWFDSLGAKSACIRIRSSVGDIVVDPGVAEMQPSYPLPHEEKLRLRRTALSHIESVCYSAKYIFITHYHYDHHVLPSDPDLRDARAMYVGSGKVLVLKNPNMYINQSQWERARLFLREVLGLVGRRLEEFLTKPERSDFPDPADKLTVALSKSFGDYDSRRRQLLQQGKEWFKKLTELWRRGSWISEIDLGNLKIVWGDDRIFNIGDVEIRVLEPWFHGVEYDKTGWITPLVIKKSNWTIFYTSDIMGPIIEDYAEFIAKLKPDIIILDGPPTYLYPYMFNRINLQRAVENAITIIKAHPRLVIYDHHLLREKKWRERVKPVFEESSKEDVPVLTAAEVLGKRPLIDEL